MTAESWRACAVAAEAGVAREQEAAAGEGGAEAWRRRAAGEEAHGAGRRAAGGRQELTTCSAPNPQGTNAAADRPRLGPG